MSKVPLFTSWAPVFIHNSPAPLQVAVPELMSERASNTLTLAPLTASAAPGAIVVVPAPPMVPPDQFMARFTVTAPLPFNVPDERSMFFAERLPFAVNVPPAMLSVPLLIEEEFVKRIEPPVIENVSSPAKLNDF